MGAQQLYHLSFIWTWILYFFFPSVCSGMDTFLKTESSVFVVVVGANLSIDCELMIPMNQSKGVMECHDPNRSIIYNCDVQATHDQPVTLPVKVPLQNLVLTGEYYCVYQEAKVLWFIQVKENAYKEPNTWNDTEFVLVSGLTTLLLVFSVTGSVYVFRGHWKDSGDTGRKEKKSREEKPERETEEDNMEALAAQSSSFYASLEPRPRSIYDVLDHSAANREPELSKTEPRKEKLQETMEQTTQQQHDDVTESIYENFEV